MKNKQIELDAEHQFWMEKASLVCTDYLVNDLMMQHTRASAYPEFNLKLRDFEPNFRGFQRLEKLTNDFLWLRDVQRREFLDEIALWHKAVKTMRVVDRCDDWSLYALERDFECVDIVRGTYWNFNSGVESWVNDFRCYIYESHTAGLVNCTSRIYIQVSNSGKAFDRAAYIDSKNAVYKMYNFPRESDVVKSVFYDVREISQ